MGKHREKKPAFGKKSRTSRVPMVASLLAAAALVAALQWLLSSSAATDAGSQRRRASSSPASPSSPRERRAASEVSAQRRGADAYSGHEWRNLSRSLPHCLSSQAELMSIPVPWPGFHALCIESFGDGEVSVLLHARSARHGDAGGEPPLAAGPEESRVLRAGVQGGGGDLLELLVEALQAELAEGEFRQVDQMVSTSAYDFHPNPWRLFTTNGGPVLSGADLGQLGPGAALWLYTGGQFLWPGVRIGHKFRVPIPRVAEDGEHSETKMVEMTTASLRPLVLVLSGFLSDGECDFIKSYAASRMVPSGLAVMDGTRGDQSDVRTSTQTFMQRGGSPRIRALEERAHNLTRLPYDNGENIQVVRYEKGQKYGAHRDFFNPNDYHRQPSMLRSVEYGARNRLATVFWYLQSVDEGGETFFPRALNEEGREYNPWNGDHEDCYRGLSVPPVRGNAVLFYSMVPDGRLDERSLHGGCKPRSEKAEKWGANQWIWNHPQRSGYFTKTPPRRGLKARRPSAAGCADEEEHCEAWAAGGECDKNSGFMARSCRASCGLC